MTATETKQDELYDFGVEVPQLMSMFINSVYSSNDLFLREAVSNASDAITKIYQSKEELDKQGYETYKYGEFKIEVIPDGKNKTITIRDNGIGMTKDDLKNFLGSIACSGTSKFKEMINNNKAITEDLIGQFGLGFYSLFLVADEVVVLTKNPKDQSYMWTSNGKTNYKIREYDYDVLHGTSVILHLKDGMDEYLNTTKLGDLIKKHSMYVKYPIGLYVEKEVEEEKKDEENTEKENGEETEEPKVEEEVKKIKKMVTEMQIINNSELQVWKKKVGEVPEEDLKKFYKELSKDYDDYLAVESFHFEGIVDVKLLLFIPKHPQTSIFTNPKEQADNIKVYNNNVFITDNLPRSVVPVWMNFVCGAVTSSDFSLNISREFLQGKGALNILKAKLPKCIAEMIKKMDDKEFDAFYKEFSKYIKMAIRDSTDNIQKMFSRFLRYSTNQGESISLDQYCEKVPETQKQILYLTGLSQAEVEKSIFLDAFKDKLVLLMPDPVDEIMLQGLKKYNDLTFHNISSEGVDLVADDVENKESYDEFTKAVTESLKTRVDKTVVSRRFSSVPATILTPGFGYSRTMEAIMRSNPDAENNPMLQMLLRSKKIFEINVDNAYIKNMKSAFDSGKNIDEQANFLYNITAMGCGYEVEDKAALVRSVFDIISDNPEVEEL